MSALFLHGVWNRHASLMLLHYFFSAHWFCCDCFSLVSFHLRWNIWKQCVKARERALQAWTLLCWKGCSWCVPFLLFVFCTTHPSRCTYTHTQTHTHAQTHTHTDIHTDRQTDRQTHIHTHTHTVRHTQSISLGINRWLLAFLSFNNWIQLLQLHDRDSRWQFEMLDLLIFFFQHCFSTLIIMNFYHILNIYSIRKVFCLGSNFSHCGLTYLEQTYWNGTLCLDSPEDRPPPPSVSASSGNLHVYFLTDYSLCRSKYSCWKFEKIEAEV